MAWCASISSSLWHRHSKLILYFHTTGSIFSEDSFGVLYCLQADNPARLRRAVQQGNLGTVRRFIRDKEARWDANGVAAACFCSTLYLAMLQWTQWTQWTLSFVTCVRCGGLFVSLWFRAKLSEAEFLEIVSAPSNLIPLALQSKCRLEMIKLLLQGWTKTN